MNCVAFYPSGKILKVAGTFRLTRVSSRLMPRVETGPNHKDPVVCLDPLALILDADSGAVVYDCRDHKKDLPKSARLALEKKSYWPDVDLCQKRLFVSREEDWKNAWHWYRDVGFAPKRET